MQKQFNKQTTNQPLPNHWQSWKHWYIKSLTFGYVVRFLFSQEPGDSKWPSYPQTLEVTNNLWKGHVNSPSQKGHKNAELPGIVCSETMNLTVCPSVFFWTDPKLLPVVFFHLASWNSSWCGKCANAKAWQINKHQGLPRWMGIVIIPIDKGLYTHYKDS